VVPGPGRRVPLAVTVTASHARGHPAGRRAWDSWFFLRGTAGFFPEAVLGSAATSAGEQGPSEGQSRRLVPVSSVINRVLGIQYLDP
jgi:hypothetical protein